jgi:hypothetical protein
MAATLTAAFLDGGLERVTRTGLPIKDASVLPVTRPNVSSRRLGYTMRRLEFVSRRSSALREELDRRAHAEGQQSDCDDPQ